VCAHSTYLDQLFQAARKRADAIRSTQGRRADSPKDIVSKFLDYASEKVTHPPLQSVEHNLIRIVDHLHAIQQTADHLVHAHDQADHKRHLNTSKPDTQCDTTVDFLRQLAALPVPRMRPVQPARHTLFADN
jgi:hypothetical protein